MIKNKDFLWYAKRGRGECINVLHQDDISKYENCVKKVVLNNYAFLLYDEFRSYFACELCSFYENDELYISEIWKKLKRTKLENLYTFEYLLNNLFFLLDRNKNLNYKEKIRKLLISHLKKIDFTHNEIMSVNAIVSLIYDLKLDIDVDNILNNYFSAYPNSNLEISVKYFEINRQIDSKEKIDFNYSPSVDDIINGFSNVKNLDKYLPIILNKLNNVEYILLFELLKNHNLSPDKNTLLLKLIYYSNFKIGMKECNILLSIYDNSDYYQRLIIENILCSKITKKHMKIIVKSDISHSLATRLLIKYYDDNFYKIIHKNICKLKIDYANSSYWYEIENDLILYFKRKNIDLRLLKDLKIFFENGLSSMSRLEIAKILYRYNYLTNDEILNLKYDANYKTRIYFDRTIIKKQI